MTLRLHNYVLSASCYKIRLMAALLGVKLELVAVDFHPGRAHKSPEFLALNPAGTLPVLEVGDQVMTESSAMLAYLATEHGRDAGWMGDGSALQAAGIQHWLAFASRLNATLGAARLHDMLNLPADIEAVRKAGIGCLRELEAHLAEARFAGRLFLVGDKPTIADIACFPNVALAGDGGVSLDPYPSIRLWQRAIRSLAHFIEMPGIHRLHELRPAPHPIEA